MLTPEDLVEEVMGSVMGPTPHGVTFKITEVSGLYVASLNGEYDGDPAWSLGVLIPDISLIVELSISDRLVQTTYRQTANRVTESYVHRGDGWYHAETGVKQ